MTAARAVRDGAVSAGLQVAGQMFIMVAPATSTIGIDAFAHRGVNRTDLCGTGIGRLGALGRSPAIVRSLGPFWVIPWPAFHWIWTGLLIGIWGGLTDRSWTVPLAATLAPPCSGANGFAICAACIGLWRPEATQQGLVPRSMATGSDPSS